MRTIKFDSFTGKEISFIPQSMRELKQLFIAFGVNAWPVKWGNHIDIKYTPEFSISTQCRTVQDMTLKQWAEIAVKHCPVTNQGEQGILWENLIRKVNQSTL